MIELALASVMVAVAVAASLAMVGATGRSARDLSDWQKGQLLADRLMSEVLMQEYEDPDGTVLFVLESGETGTTRSTFDDVDDYHGWTASPPQDKRGTALPDSTGWTESVSVTRADTSNLNGNRAIESGVKRIVVRMSKGNVAVTRTAIRTSAWRTLENQ